MERPTVLTGRFPKKGSSKLKMVKDEYYKALVRAIQVTDRFDRVGLTVMLHTFPAPTRDGIFVALNTKLNELFDNGFIEVATMDTTRGTLAIQYEYTVEEFDKNPELVGLLDFQLGPKKMVVFRKSATWPDFMGLWQTFTS